MQISNFQAEVQAVGGTLAIEGKDITEHIAGFDLSVRPGQPTQLTVFTIPEEGSISGVSQVVAVIPATQGLEDLSADQIEEEAMERMGFDSEFDDKPLAQHIIDIIKEKMS